MKLVSFKELGFKVVINGFFILNLVKTLPCYFLYLFNISSSGQMLVNADCKRLIPTNAGSKSQYGATNHERRTPIMIMLPATALMIISVFICFCFL